MYKPSERYWIDKARGTARAREILERIAAHDLLYKYPLTDEGLTILNHAWLRLAQGWDNAFYKFVMA